MDAVGQLHAGSEIIASSEYPDRDRGAGCPETPGLPDCPLRPSSGGVLRCQQRYTAS